MNLFLIILDFFHLYHYKLFGLMTFDCDGLESRNQFAKSEITVVFTCVAEGESRSRSAVTPSVCPSVGLSVRPSQNLVIATPLKLLIQLSCNLVCR